MPSNRFRRGQYTRQRRKLYIIATEGEKTEDIYFSVFNGDDFRKNVHVRILNTKRGKSAPKQVLNRLQRYTHDMGVNDDDELWVVVDVDSWGAEALDQLCRECDRTGYGVAVSNPCFELWLVLYQENPCTPPVRRDCEQELRRLLGRFEKSEYDVSKLIPYIHNAIQHARRLDRDQHAHWPHETGTHVYKLVKKLIE